MTAHIDWKQVARHIATLYEASESLNAMFPGRKFTLDGHLVGSIGEVIAAYMFDLNLTPASTTNHDATTNDGRKVEIKLTQGRTVALRHEPEHLIVLHRSKDARTRVVYNGPGAIAWQHVGKMQKNGQCPISLARLSRLAESIPERDQLPEMREPPV